MERAARVELASSGWKPEAPAAIPCSQWREMKDSNPRIWIWKPASWPLNESPANFMAVATGVEPVSPDRQSGVLAARPCDHFNSEEGTVSYGIFLVKRSNRSLHHSSKLQFRSNLGCRERIEPGSPAHAVLFFACAGVARTLIASFKDSCPTVERPGNAPPLIVLQMYSAGSSGENRTPISALKEPHPGR